MPDSYALVYRRPDGWWLAGHGWLSVEEARKDGEGHNWLGAAWGVVNSADVVDIDGDQRLPIGREPTLHLVEHGAYFPEVEGARRVLSAAKKAQPVVALPPCPTCKGDRSCTCGGEDSDGSRKEQP